MDKNLKSDNLLHVAGEYWISALFLAFATINFIGVWLGDGAPVYGQYPFIGQGLLKPWLHWSIADRWRLHELEPPAYEKYSKKGQPWSVTFWGLRFLVMPPEYLRDLETQDRHALNLAKCLSDALNMEASVGDIPIANTMEIDVVSKYLNSQVAQKDRPDIKKNLDTIQLMVDMPPASPKEVDSFRHAIRVLHLHFASTGSSIALVHAAIWQLLQMPECIELIRAEIEDVLKKYGSWDSKHTLNHLHLLDSFVREILRVHVPSALVSLRLAQQPVTLHDGFQLKQGTRIVFSAQSIHSDPANYDSPREFQPFRFAGSGPCNCEADGTPKDAGRVKAETPSQSFLAFGYGKQSCPGRFFATRVVKLILGRLIHEYEIEAAGTIPPSPVSGSMEGFFLPTKKLEISLRSRRIK
ncbi:uncharacterized protein N0V89_004840 [Didymosphaeria variabile]|uniref:Cytochrome P450 n=1 Tax=Didymosphaeria variabile TaxID=1932322 RepID=A0A9W8XQ59_9PLEO|nr:uncharacterized protein N0V89_004840 [Didymosphaeria variabile]KAJ4356803.1 hypothetical protein N0V89_004840 [Didymosphaeria variabile]